MNETKLNPCPYCRSAYIEAAPDGVKVRIIENEWKQTAYQVTCSICKARGPRMASEEAAVRYWNRRR